MKYAKLIPYAIIIALAIWLYLERQAKVEATILQEAQQAATDTMRTYVDELGRQVAQVSSIVVQKEKDLLQLNASHSDELRRLQELVRSQRGKVLGGTAVSSRTDVSSTVPTVRDTVAAAVVNYYGEYHDEWVDWKGVATPDSFSVDITVRNDWDLVEVKRNPLFKRASVEATLINHNPYTETEELKHFSVRPQRKWLNIGPQVTYGLDPLTGSTHTVLGVGAQLNILPVK